MGVDCSQEVVGQTDVVDVVGGSEADPLIQHTVRAVNIRLVLPVIRSDLVVANRIANVRSPADVASTHGTVPRAVPSSEDLIEQIRRDSVPPGIKQSLATD